VAPGLTWLTARPIAHRGLHNAQEGIIENTPSAFSAAVAGGYGIECDLQRSADGEAMVHHDDVLGRLNEGRGRLDGMTAAELRRVAFKATTDRMISLGELCDLVAGRATLVIELKSRFDRDQRLVARAADVLSHYRGAAALISFDPTQIAALRTIAPKLLRGMVAESRYRDHDWDELSAVTKRSMTAFAHAWSTRPQFIAYALRDLPATIPLLARKAFGLPLLTWTVRSVEDRQRAARYADQMIFEGFRP
jgi:glycerophosphoryl diester phosphodiesterase